MTSHRLNLYFGDRTNAILETHADSGNRSPWIVSAIERYAAIITDEKRRLARLITQAEAQEIVAATQDRLYDHDTVAHLIISQTRSPHLAELMRNITLAQRAALAEACARYHRRRSLGEAVQPTIECLFG